MRCVGAGRVLTDRGGVPSHAHSGKLRGATRGPGHAAGGGPGDGARQPGLGHPSHRSGNGRHLSRLQFALKREEAKDLSCSWIGIREQRGSTARNVRYRRGGGRRGGGSRTGAGEWGQTTGREEGRHVESRRAGKGERPRRGPPGAHAPLEGTDARFPRDNSHGTAKRAGIHPCRRGRTSSSPTRAGRGRGPPRRPGGRPGSVLAGFARLVSRYHPHARA